MSAEAAKRPLRQAIATAAAIVAFMVGAAWLVSACTSNAEPQEFLHQFLVGWACVFASIAIALVFNREPRPD